MGRAGSSSATTVLLFTLPMWFTWRLLLLVASVSSLPSSEIDPLAQKVRLYIDLEKVNYYRGVIRQLVKLDDEVVCLRPDMMTIRCPERAQIYVQSAALKRPRSVPTGTLGDCPVSGNASLISLAQSRCRISRALQVVKLRCEERQQCKLVNPGTGQHPRGADPYDLNSCEQLLPHLQVKYTCEPTIRTRFLCADTYSTIGCDERQKLMVLDALLTDKYMFQDEQCPNTANVELGVGNCQDTNIFDEAKRECDSKTSCTVGALQTVKQGCARPNMLLLYACVPKRGYDLSRRPSLPAERERLPPSVDTNPQDFDSVPPDGPNSPSSTGGGGGGGGGGGSGSSGGGWGKSMPSTESTKDRESAATSSSDAADAGNGGGSADLNGTNGSGQLLSGRHLVLLCSAVGGALFIVVVATIGCLATRRWLRGRRRREEEHLARMNLSKQIPPPSTCLLIPPAETLLKLPSPTSGSQPGSGSAAQTVSVCLSQLGSPPCSSVDGSNSDRQSTSATSTFLTGSAASRAGSLPSPRESMTTYSVHQHHCTTSVLEELAGHQQLGMI